MRLVARIERVRVEHLLQARLRLRRRRAEDANSAAGAAARNLCAVKARGWAERADELDDCIRRLRPQAYRRIGRVALIHELTELYKLACRWCRGKERAEGAHTEVLIDGMRRAAA